MKVRVFVVIVTIAVAAHAAIFIALGRLARREGPVLPPKLPAATAAPAATPHPAVVEHETTATPPPTPTAAPAARSRKPAANVRRRSDVAEHAAAPARPVFDIESPTTDQ